MTANSCMNCAEHRSTALPLSGSRIAAPERPICVDMRSPADLGRADEQRGAEADGEADERLAEERRRRDAERRRASRRRAPTGASRSVRSSSSPVRTRIGTVCAENTGATSTSPPDAAARTARASAPTPGAKRSNVDERSIAALRTRATGGSGTARSCTSSRSCSIHGSATRNVARDGDELRHERERLLLDLRDRLDDAHDEPDDERDDAASARRRAWRA